MIVEKDIKIQNKRLLSFAQNLFQSQSSGGFNFKHFCFIFFLVILFLSINNMLISPFHDLSTFTNTYCLHL